MLGVDLHEVPNIRVRERSQSKRLLPRAPDVEQPLLLRRLVCACSRIGLSIAGRHGRAGNGFAFRRKGCTRWLRCDMTGPAPRPPSAAQSLPGRDTNLGVAVAMESSTSDALKLGREIHRAPNVGAKLPVDGEGATFPVCAPKHQAALNTPLSRLMAGRSI